MALKDHQVPGSVVYVKLSDFPDEEEIIVKGAGVLTGGKYGDQPYLIASSGERITLPGRYCDYIRDLVLDDEALREMSAGVKIRKSSFEYDKEKMTPTFDFI